MSGGVGLVALWLVLIHAWAYWDQITGAARQTRRTWRWWRLSRRIRKYRSTINR